MMQWRSLTLFILGAGLLASACTMAGKRTASEHQVSPPPESRARTGDPCTDLNAATAEELTRLPGVGDVIARRIVDYRTQHGRLRRPQEIIMIEGFSERKYRAIAHLVCVQ